MSRNSELTLPPIHVVLNWFEELKRRTPPSETPATIAPLESEDAVALSAGKRLGPYEILSPLGTGGMGEVYRARDSRLGRDVAIKVLPEEWHSDPERLRRFEQEAKAAGALNHPNLLAVYDVGIHNGAPYIVSELLEGETLRERLRPGELSPRKALEMAIAIAHGLSAAHAKGVVHRDLKPANVFVMTDGHVKILDFGLAKLVREKTGSESETASQVTDAGTAMGTPGYMSPEQIRGQPADQRSDIFSFGVLLHEMVAGSKPFRGESAADVISAVLRQDAPDLSESGANAPPGLERIVRRCLEKRPEDRFHSAHDLALALEAVATSSEGHPPRIAAHTAASIAVLPFTDLSPTKDQEWFTDGLAEEIINVLAQLPGLTVIARTSAFAFKAKNEDVRGIGKALGVAHVLEGSVRRAGDRIRVIAQLVTAETGHHLWSERYDREMSDVFAIQDDIAQAIAKALQLRLSAAPSALRRRAPNLAAYDLYLKARHQLPRLDREALASAREYLEQAIAIDPEFALAHVALAEYFVTLAMYGPQQPPREVFPLARRIAQKALALDSSLREAHAVLGTVAALNDYDWNEASRQFDLARAGAVVPPHVRTMYALTYLLVRGDTAAAIAEYERAIDEDPLNLGWRSDYALCLCCAGRSDEAMRELTELLALSPGFVSANVRLAAVWFAKRVWVAALAKAQEALSAIPYDPSLIGLVAGLHKRTENMERALDVLKGFEQLQPYQTTMGMFVFHLAAGDVVEAAGLAGRLVEERQPLLLLFLMSPLGETFRASVHWLPLAERLGFRPAPT